VCVCVCERVKKKNGAKGLKRRMEWSGSRVDSQSCKKRPQTKKNEKVGN
jgi:hypothetical protein